MNLAPTIFDVHDKRFPYQYALATLNGEPLKFCWRACPEEGWADIYPTKEGGSVPVHNSDRTGLETLRVFGKVVVIDTRTNEPWEGRPDKAYGPPT